MLVTPSLLASYVDKTKLTLSNEEHFMEEALRIMNQPSSSTLTKVLQLHGLLWIEKLPQPRDLKLKTDPP